MNREAVFVDLPNFYSHLLRSKIGQPRLLRDYFLKWFDFDRLAAALTGGSPSVWVFYSGRRFGPSHNRIEGKYLDEYIGRTNALTGVTAWNVNIGGKQREAATYVCEQCGHEGVVQWESEKGIDASLTVRLFDTMDSWDVAYLLSGDADFVPAVASLRRRGKRVVGAGFPARSPALVRECYKYVDLCELFLREDVAAYLLFKEDGVVQKWLLGEVDGAARDEGVTLGVEFKRIGEADETGCSEGAVSPCRRCYLFVDPGGSLDLSTRIAEVERLQAVCDRVVAKVEPGASCTLVFTPMVWQGVERRLASDMPYLRDAAPYPVASGHGWQVKYRYDAAAAKYVRAA
jgi:uncharacterized LabA/DUF88 family protein